MIKQEKARFIVTKGQQVFIELILVLVVAVGPLGRIVFVLALLCTVLLLR